MRFDNRTRRYYQGSRELSPAEVRKHVDSYITDEQKEVDREAQRLLVGAITLAAFFEFMREKVHAWHTITGVIAYGGQSQMDAERWARINEKVQSEIAYLMTFEQEAQASFAAAEKAAKQAAEAIVSDIPARLDTVVEERVAQALITVAPWEAENVAQAVVEDVLADSIGAEAAATIAEAVVLDKAGAILDSLIGGTIPTRAAMYPNAAYATFANQEVERERDEGITLARRVCEEDEASCDECVAAATEEYIPLDEISDIGSLTCMCITTPDSRVVTDRGWIPIIDVVPGDRVWTHKARWQRVLAIITRNSTPQHSFATVTSPTGRAVGFTDDHKLLTKRGWLPLNTILHNELSVYNWQHELLQKLRLSDEAFITWRLPLPPMPWEMPLWEREGLQGKRMPIMRDESQSKSAMGESPTINHGGHCQVSQAAAHSIRGFDLGRQLGDQIGGWSPLQMVLGRRSETNHLSLSMGMDQSPWPDSTKACSPSQERRSHLRLPLEFGTQDRLQAQDRSPNGQPASVCAKRQVSDMRDCVSGEAPFSYEKAEILLCPMQQTPVLLWDLEVACDHSFIVEGIVAHNSNCRCTIEFSYEGVEPLRVDATVSDIFA